MSLFKIKNLYNDSIIFETEIKEENLSYEEKLGKVAILAIESSVNLQGADLRYASIRNASLQGADLRNANLQYVNLQGANLEGVNLQGANLEGVNLQYVNLQGANLEGVNLRNADLRNASLQGADLRNANLEGVNLQGANLEGADLRNANLQYVNLRYANLQGANLRYADLEGANLRNADLRNANLQGASLRNADLLDCKTPHFQIPQEGSLIVYKKVSGGVCKLQIPENAKRTASLIGKKCRAEFVIVLESPENNAGKHDPSIKYEVGKTIYPDSYDSNPTIECTHGIHFFLTREEAEEY